MHKVNQEHLFWTDTHNERVSVLRPPIPETNWTLPTELPDLSSAKAIGLDVETYEPDFDHGAGWARSCGHIVGVSLAVPDGHKWYLPIRHEIEPHNNLDPQRVFHYLKETLSNSHQVKIGANLMYDLGHLAEYGIKVKGRLIDVQFAEALLSERARVGLDTLAQKYLDEGKETSLLYQWLSDYYGGPATGDQRGNIYRSPARLAGAYAEADAELPIRIFNKQYNELNKRGLMPVFNMECALIPLLIKMRQAGVRIDIPKAEKLSEDFGKQIVTLNKDLHKTLGYPINVNAATDLTKTFDDLKIKYPLTPAGNPSFKKDFLNKVQHPVGKAIVKIRQLEHLKNTFIESYLLESHVDGFVYCSFHPLRAESYGTRSGRFSSSDPNLQNIPVRSDMGRILRGVFIPDIGHKDWLCYDYSQIEYRVLANYAIGQGAHELRQAYKDDPTISYHKLMHQTILEKTGKDIGYKSAKNTNFGIVYGMGEKKLSKDLGLTLSAGKQFLSDYHSGAPFVQATMDACGQYAAKHGYIDTIMGRRSYFDLWEPAGYSEDFKPALEYSAALRAYGPRITRAGLYKALNRKLQGSAADMLKAAMLKCELDGVFAETGVPRLTVHDELDFSNPGGKEKAFKEVVHIMESVVPLKVPVLVDCESGSNWGNVQ